MSARIALLVVILWAGSLVGAYQFGARNTNNASQAKAVPALVQVIQEHDQKAEAGHQVEVKATRAIARTDAVFDEINNEVLNYAKQNAGVADCELDAAGLRIWSAANANAAPEAEGQGPGQPDGRLPGPPAADERQENGAPEQSRTGGEAVSQVPGASSRPGGMDGKEAMTDIVDLALQSEEEARSRALQAQAARAGLSTKTVADSAEECAVCEEPIPQARREAVPGVQTCIECQQDLEGAMRAHTRGYP